MGIRQSFRPKHQVLISKCYPKYQKSTTEVKPNSSELSYLLYYASTRRSKLHKVGAYLEQRTSRDVRRARLGNVQVTLQILTALIEKCPRDLGLYSSFVLNILDMVFRSGDINFIECSIPTFTALCTHLDQSTFAAEASQSQQYEGIISSYASIATRATPGQPSARGSLPETLRFRTAGLKAISGLVASDAFPANPAHLRIVGPAILQQLTSDDPHYLSRLEQRESAKDERDKELYMKRRPSLSATKSFEAPRTPRATDSTDADPIAAAGSTADVDRRAAEEVGVLALQTLRTIFSTDNRGQVRSATTLMIDLSLQYDNGKGISTKTKKTPFLSSSVSPWLTSLFDRVTEWTPVQDRFIILVTMVESLNTPTTSWASEKDPTPSTDNRTQLPPLITHLLRSPYTFIGLSVLDVLIGILDTMRSTSSPSQPSDSDLQLARLRDSVGALAGHIYYGDQIADMVSTIVTRLPSSLAQACVQEVLDVSRTDLRSLRLPPHVRAELGLEGPDDTKTQLSKGSGSNSGSGSRARAARERELRLRNDAKVNGAPPREESRQSVLGVEDLKRALSGVFVPVKASRPLSTDTGTDSMVSGGFTGSEVSLPMHLEGGMNGLGTGSRNGDGYGQGLGQAHGYGNGQGYAPAHSHGNPNGQTSAVAAGKRHSKEAEPLQHDTPPLDTDVPPVPALPVGVKGR